MILVFQLAEGNSLQSIQPILDQHGAIARMMMCFTSFFYIDNLKKEDLENLASLLILLPEIDSAYIKESGKLPQYK